MYTEHVGLLVASAEFESEAYPENILRVEALADGMSILTTYNSKHEMTAQSFHGIGKVGRS